MTIILIWLGICVILYGGTYLLGALFAVSEDDNKSEENGYMAAWIISTFICSVVTVIFMLSQGLISLK